MLRGMLCQRTALFVTLTQQLIGIDIVNSIVIVKSQSLGLTLLVLPQQRLTCPFNHWQDARVLH